MPQNSTRVTVSDPAGTAAPDVLYEIQWWVVSKGIIARDLIGEPVLTGLQPRAAAAIIAFVRAQSFEPDVRMKLTVLQNGIRRATVLCHPPDVLTWNPARRTLPLPARPVSEPVSPAANRLAIAEAVREVLERGVAADVLGTPDLMALFDHLELALDRHRERAAPSHRRN